MQKKTKLKILKLTIHFLLRGPEQVNSVTVQRFCVVRHTHTQPASANSEPVCDVQH